MKAFHSQCSFLGGAGEGRQRAVNGFKEEGQQASEEGLEKDNAEKT